MNRPPIRARLAILLLALFPIPVAVAGEPLPAGAIAPLGSSAYCEPGSVNAVAFAPDGKGFACGADACGAVHILDAATGRRTATLEVGAYQVLSVAYLHGGKEIVAGARDGIVSVWDVAERRRLRDIKGSGW